MNSCKGSHAQRSSPWPWNIWKKELFILSLNSWRTCLNGLMTILGDWPVYPIASHEIETFGASSKKVAPWALELSIPNISQHTILQQTNETREMGLHWSTGYASYMIIYGSAIPRLIKFPKRFQAIIVFNIMQPQKNTQTSDCWQASLGDALMDLNTSNATCHCSAFSQAFIALAGFLIGDWPIGCKAPKFQTMTGCSVEGDNVRLAASLRTTETLKVLTWKVRPI